MKNMKAILFDSGKVLNGPAKILPILRKKFKLAIVSDAWPSLRDVYIEQGMDKYFDCFVISSM